MSAKVHDLALLRAAETTASLVKAVTASTVLHVSGLEPPSDVSTSEPLRIRGCRDLGIGHQERQSYQRHSSLDHPNRCQFTLWSHHTLCGKEGLQPTAWIDSPELEIVDVGCLDSGQVNCSHRSTLLISWAQGYEPSSYAIRGANT